MEGEVVLTATIPRQLLPFGGSRATRVYDGRNYKDPLDSLSPFDDCSLCILDFTHYVDTGEDRASLLLLGPRF